MKLNANPSFSRGIPTNQHNNMRQGESLDREGTLKAMTEIVEAKNSPAFEWGVNLLIVGTAFASAYFLVKATSDMTAEAIIKKQKQQQKEVKASPQLNHMA
jgi:hypothetical protein